MLKKIAIVYLMIQSVYFSYKIYGALGNQLWQELMFWVGWSINILGLFAVAGFAFNRQVFQPLYWELILIVYVGLRVYELVPNGLFIYEWSLMQNTLIGAQYLWLVLPSILAMLYLAFATKSRGS